MIYYTIKYDTTLLLIAAVKTVALHVAVLNLRDTLTTGAHPLALVTPLSDCNGRNHLMAD